ncbi:MAG TPA: lipid-binding SYLF domain-containing protein [Vicinamibacterales bacterium]|jgi:lipid-binding SYLF domain-containing protein|nr:lipid-binding SYLF domain-containing protein [Vicinamibacterales bacterium]
MTTKCAAAVAAIALTLLPRLALAQQAETDRVTEAARVLEEVLAAPDKGVPQAIIEKAQAIVVIPSTVKGALLIGAQRGKGVMSARSATGWSAPAFVTLTGGSLGLQIGGQATDIVLVVTNERGIENLAQNTFKIGGDASVAAGPVGREATASTDYRMQAQILSYSRSRGLFAGVSLAGSTIRADRDANERIYGIGYSTRNIVVERRVEPTAAAQEWLKVLAEKM